MNKLIYATILFTLCAVNLSCGRDYGDDGSLADSIIGQEYFFSSTVTEEDMSNARNICDAYRSKRLRALGGQMLSNFNYELSALNCDGEGTGKESLAEVRVSSDGHMTLSSTDSLYMAQLESDIFGSLSGICTKISAGEEISKISYSTESVVLMVAFTTTGHQLITGIKTDPSKEKYLLIKKEVFIVNTTSLPFERYGLVEKYTREQDCANSNQIQRKSQELKSIQ